MSILVIALFAGAMFFLQQQLYRRFFDKGVQVSLSFDSEMVTAGETVKLLEVVENRKWLPLATLKVKFQCHRALEFEDMDNSAVTDLFYRNDLFSVMGYQRITRSHKVHCPKRGYYGINGIDLVGTDLFFSEEMYVHLESEAALYVLPGRYELPSLQAALKKINGEVVARRYELEDPFTYRGIREYEPYDEMRRINWKASAKTGDLKVNMRECTSVKAVRIFLNLTDRSILRREELLEMSISICAREAEELLGSGIGLSVYANARDCRNGQVLSLERLSDQGSFSTLLKALARLDLTQETADFETCFFEKLFSEEALYTIMISPECHEEFQRLLLACQEKMELAWICPMKSKEEKEILQELTDCVMIVRNET